MEIISKIDVLRDTLKQARQDERSLCFVPTMGNLHSGHLELVKRAKQLGELVVVSIFVNPLQFGVNEDLDNYPRTLEADCQALQAEGVDFVFTPTVDDMYGDNQKNHTQVIVPGLTERLCGGSRPGHFDGVATVVTKLFNMVQPDFAIFGEKDFQQLQVIRKLTHDLALPITIVGVPTVREPSGLAKSSRNGYLTQDQKEQAAQLYRCLQDCARELKHTGVDHKALEKGYIDKLNQAGFRTDYFEICDAHTLEPASAESHNLVICAAAFLGKTRLIDNIQVHRT
jgi:pantoate--beta-alanine ligase